jgi:hypothetical protein
VHYGRRAYMFIGNFSLSEVEGAKLEIQNQSLEETMSIMYCGKMMSAKIYIF